MTEVDQAGVPAHRNGAGPGGAGPGGAGTASSATGPGDQSGARTEVQSLDRAAAFAAGPSKIPRRVIAIFLVSLAAIGLGGVVLDHFFPGPVSTSTTTTLASNYPPPLQTTPAGAQGAKAGAPAPPAPQLTASQSALMSLERLNVAAAPGFTLTDQHGRRVSLASLRGKVVVLSFFDAACDDICPVLKKELSQAYADLGQLGYGVAIVTVNTDPLALTNSAARPAEAASHAPLPADWYFLTGSLSQLNAVWTNYGISIDVQRDTGIVSHNDFLYFIDPSGRLRLRATPFANESTSGLFSLPGSAEAAWAAGIADQAKSLLRGRA
ncbi:MAG TPA: SCO family protein [Acidimicrobiales bacterium]|nr:SCO family protein [Acidimicrobiales bacterium]